MRDPGIVEIIIDEVYLEHGRQVKKWGIQDHDPFVWLGLATEELGELSNAISECMWRNGGSMDVVKEAIQVSTLCIKIAGMYLKLIQEESGG